MVPGRRAPAVPSQCHREGTSATHSHAADSARIRCRARERRRSRRTGGHVSLTNVTTHNVADAKAHLSQLLDAALKGEDVIVARAGKPLVRLVPVNTPAARVLGFLDLPSPDERFDPLDETELAAWS